MTDGLTVPGVIDPNYVPAILEVFSNSERAWFAALVVAADGSALTVRFIDAQGERREKSAYCDDPRVAPLGTHLGSQLPPGVQAVPSSTRPGQFSYFDSVVQQKFATAELAWQAYLERHLLSDGADDDEPVFPAPEPMPSRQVLSGSCDVPLSPSDKGNSVPSLPAHPHVAGTLPVDETELLAETDDSQAGLHIPQSWLPPTGSCPVSAPSGLVLDGCSTTMANAVQAAVAEAMRGDCGRDELTTTLPEVDEHRELEPREFNLTVMVEGTPEDGTLENPTVAAAPSPAAPLALGVQQVAFRSQSPCGQAGGAATGLPPIREEQGPGSVITATPGSYSAAGGMKSGVEDLQTSYVYRNSSGGDSSVDRVARVSTASTTVESCLVEGPLVVAGPLPAAEVQILNATPPTALPLQRPVALPAAAPSTANDGTCSAIEGPRATPPKSAPSAAALNLSAVEGPSLATGKPVPRVAPATAASLAAASMPLQGRLMRPSGGASDISHMAGTRPAAPSTAPVLHSAMAPSSAPVPQLVTGSLPQASPVAAQLASHMVRPSDAIGASYRPQPVGVEQAPAQLGATRVNHGCAISSAAMVTPSMPGSTPIYEQRGGKAETVRVSVPITELATPQRAGMVELPSFEAPKGPGANQEAYLQACGVDVLPGAAQQPPTAALSPDLAKTYGWNELQTGLSQAQDYHTTVQHAKNLPHDLGAGMQHAGMVGCAARPQPPQRDLGAQSHGMQHSQQQHQQQLQQQQANGVDEVVDDFGKEAPARALPATTAQLSSRDKSQACLVAKIGSQQALDPSPPAAVTLLMSQNVEEEAIRELEEALRGYRASSDFDGGKTKQPSKEKADTPPKWAVPWAEPQFVDSGATPTLVKDVIGTPRASYTGEYAEIPLGEFEEIGCGTPPHMGRKANWGRATTNWWMHVSGTPVVPETDGATSNQGGPLIYETAPPLPHEVTSLSSRSWDKIKDASPTTAHADGRLQPSGETAVPRLQLQRKESEGGNDEPGAAEKRRQQRLESLAQRQAQRRDNQQHRQQEWQKQLQHEKEVRAYGTAESEFSISPRSAGYQYEQSTQVFRAQKPVAKQTVILDSSMVVPAHATLFSMWGCCVEAGTLATPNREKPFLAEI